MNVRANSICQLNKSDKKQASSIAPVQGLRVHSDFNKVFTYLSLCQVFVFLFLE